MERAGANSRGVRAILSAQSSIICRGNGRPLHVFGKRTEPCPLVLNFPPAIFGYAVVFECLFNCNLKRVLKMISDAFVSFEYVQVEAHHLITFDLETAG